MHLAACTYGKARIRIMRVQRDTARHDVRELDVNVMLEGDVAASFTSSDNSGLVATDTIKNIVNLVAREAIELDSEAFAAEVAECLLSRYAHMQAASVTTRELRWVRLQVDGAPHDHAFRPDGNGTPVVSLRATRHGHTVTSGIEGLTVLKTTRSAFVDFYRDELTTLPDAADRLMATAMDAHWTWSDTPAAAATANAAVTEAMLRVFAVTDSPSVQNTMYQMGVAALEAAPAITRISLACPNKHYLPIRLDGFGRDNPNLVFTPTDEPHGQIECTVAR